MRGVAYIILTEKKIQFVKLRNSAAIFNHSTKLAESNKLFPLLHALLLSMARTETITLNYLEPFVWTQQESALG